MAYEIPGFSFSLPSGTDFWSNGTGTQYQFVQINSSGVVVAPSAGGAVVGVRQNRPKAGEAATIMAHGISQVVSGDNTIVAGSLLAATATGNVAVATSGQYIVGTALEASSATGIIIAGRRGSNAKA